MNIIIASYITEGMRIEIKRTKKVSLLQRTNENTDQKRLIECRGDLPPNLVPHLKLGIFHFMFFNVAKFLVLADGYSMSYAA
jgi:hypothetical protein